MNTQISSDALRRAADTLDPYAALGIRDQPFILNNIQNTE